MKIKRFIANNVYGHMDFDIRFNEDLTFLTGINGSGKTTVVDSISALITPSLVTLACTDFEKMEVDIEDERELKIWAVKKQNQLALESSETDEPFKMDLLPTATDRGLRYAERSELEHYEEIAAENANHPVLNLVRSLPPPLLLGIERRYQEAVVTARHPVRFGTRRILRESRSVDSLTSRLLESVELAERRYSRLQGDQLVLAEALRADMIKRSLKYERFDIISEFRFQSREIRSKEQEYLQTLRRIGFYSEGVEADLQLFYNDLERMDDLAKQRNIGKILSDGSDEEKMAIVQWLINAPNFNRLSDMLSYIEEYNRQTAKLNEPIRRYLDIVNSFLQDSNKRLEFDKDSHLSVYIGDVDSIPLTSLSSGESQIVLLITHLSFNPAAQRANVFIVDEPELSLHVRWQEIFVESVRKANPNLQIILATHSPSIVLDDIEHCVDLGEGVA